MRTDEQIKRLGDRDIAPMIKRLGDRDIAPMIKRLGDRDIAPMMSSQPVCLTPPIASISALVGFRQIRVVEGQGQQQEEHSWQPFMFVVLSCGSISSEC